eukprot:g6384.t1
MELAAVECKGSEKIFQIAVQCTETRARCGTLLDNTPTPNIICNTISCALPLVTPDLLKGDKHLNETIGKLPIAVPVEDLVLEKGLFHSRKPAQNADAGDYTLHQHCNVSPSTLIFFTPRLCGSIPTGPSNDKQITVESAQGRRGITVDIYSSMISSIKADVSISLCDEVPNDASKNRHDKSVRRTLNWLKETLKSLRPGLSADISVKTATNSNVSEPAQKKRKVGAGTPQVGNMEEKRHVIFGVVLGGTYEHLRKISAENTAELPVDGYVLGGFNLGETNEERKTILAATTPLLDESKCRVLKSVNNPIDILDAISCGMDLVECDYAYHVSRMCYASTYKIPSIEYTDYENFESENPNFCPGDRTKINLRDKRFERDTRALLPGCKCFTCRSYTRAYINHLLNAHEMLADTLLYIHNLYHLRLLVSTARKHVAKGAFSDFVANFVKGQKMYVVDMDTQ